LDYFEDFRTENCSDQGQIMALTVLFVPNSLDKCQAKAASDGYFIAEEPAPAPHLARPEEPAALTHMC